MTKLPRLLICAPSSGSGKTTFTIALLGALKNRSLEPCAFKCGPDYIDPMFHQRVLGIRGGNLDLFFTQESLVRGLLCAGAEKSGIAVLEGAMGYYDGIAMSDEASSYKMTQATGTPAVLVIRPQGSALSAAALVGGFMGFRSPSHIKGVILNGCSEAMAFRYVQAIEGECGVKVYGFLPNIPEAEIKSRHLGLVTPDAVAKLQDKAELLALRAMETVDIDGLLLLAASAPELEGRLPYISPVGQNITVATAMDEAFCFYYKENLSLLERLGCNIMTFSPLRDSRLPENAAALYIPGGYPELHAGALSENLSMKRAVRKAIEGGMPTIAECGGFMYLGKSLEDGKGQAHDMVGVFNFDSFSGKSLRRFGYVTMTAQKDNLLCKACDKINAHEFHYWDTAENGNGFTAAKPQSDKSWQCCITSESLYAGFPHLYFWSNIKFAENFARAAKSYKEKNNLE